MLRFFTVGALQLFEVAGWLLFGWANIASMAFSQAPKGQDTAELVPTTLQSAANADSGSVLARLRSYTEGHPGDAEGWFQFGEALFRSGMPSESLSALERGGQLRPSSAVEDRTGGADYVLLGNLEGARTLFERALRKNGSDQIARYYLARTLYRQNEFAQAADAFRLVLAAIPGDLRARDGLALSLAGMGDVTQATAQFALALKHAPDSKEDTCYLHTDAAYFFYETGDSVKALREAEAALALEQTPASRDDQARASQIAGHIVLQTGDARAALEYLQRSVQLSPLDSSTHFLLGRAYKLAGNPAKASTEFELTRRLIGERSNTP